jgi:hypothetical protein
VLVKAPQPELEATELMVVMVQALVEEETVATVATVAAVMAAHMQLVDFSDQTDQ